MSWATNGDAEVTEPSAGYRAAGFRSGDPLPAGVLNWVIRLLGMGYSSPAEAVDKAAAGSMAVVDETDMANRPGSEVAAAANTANVSSSVDCDGKYVVFSDQVSGDYVAVLLLRGTLGTAVLTFTPTSNPTSPINRVFTDGSYVFTAAQSGTVTCWAIDDNSSPAWTYEHGAAVQDIISDGTILYLVGGAGTGTKDVRAITISSGAALWSYNHLGGAGGLVIGVALAAGRVVIASNIASAHGSGATLRALNASNGFDAAGEGGTGTDTVGLAWDLVSSVLGSNPRCLASDGKRIFEGLGSSNPYQLNVRAAHTGEVIAGIPLALTPYSVSCDQRNVYIAADDGSTVSRVYAVGKQDLVVQWDYRSQATGYNRVNGVASDGFRVFCAVDDNTATGRERVSLYRGNTTPATCKRPLTSDQYKPYQWLLIPEEGS